jgi:hypothetical protein
MKVEIELYSGPGSNEYVTKADVQKNLDALQRAIDGRPLCSAIAEDHEAYRKEKCR